MVKLKKIKNFRKVKKQKNLIRFSLISLIVIFSFFSLPTINNYLDKNEWRGCAGGYNLMGSAIEFFPYISGCYSSVIGLPLPKLKNILRGLGYSKNL